MRLQTILTFAETGPDASSVVEVAYGDLELPPLQESGVAVEFMASPINPQDLLVLTGHYPVQPSHRHSDQLIPGYDGVCRIIDVGSAVTCFQPGDHAIPMRHGVGTWRSHAILEESALVKVPRELDPVAASLLKMGAVVAWLLLQERDTLRPGDWLVQNAASGVIAHYVAQLARLRGLRTLSVVRDRDNLEPLRRRLLDAGSDIVLTERELDALLKDAQPVPILAGKRVVLALDSVFGDSGNRLVELLSQGGSYVNYGSLAGENSFLRLSQKDLFWKRVTFKNFRLSAALNQYDNAEFTDLLSWLSGLFLQGQLDIPDVQLVHLYPGPGVHAVVRSALAQAADKDMVGIRKQMFLFNRN